MIRSPFVLLLAGLCVSAALAADEGTIPLQTAPVADQSQVQGAPVPPAASNPAPIQDQQRIDQSQVSQQPVAQAPASGAVADRSGPVPFGDLGNVGGGQVVADQKAIDQDRLLAVSGEVSGDELILHLPAGTIKDTLSLRNDRGLDIRRNELLSMGSWQGDDLHLRLADLGLSANPDLGNLWVWGTGPASSSLLQRVAMGGNINQPIASTEPAPSRPLYQPNVVGAPLPPERQQIPDQQLQQQQQPVPEQPAPQSQGY